MGVPGMLGVPGMPGMPGMPGVPGHPHILADQLTLYQPGGADYAHHITTGTPGSINLHIIFTYLESNFLVSYRFL